MWPTHVYRTPPNEPLPGWLSVVMFWTIMPAAFVGMVVRFSRQLKEP